jgi:NADH-quinone oxidoreductase subunit L
MLIGTLALTGFPYTAGYYSKDAILFAAYLAESQWGELAFILGITAATLTSFYSWRLAFLTFEGKPRWDQSEHIQHATHGDHGHGDEGHDNHGHDSHRHGHASGDGTAGYHPHESPWTMLVPLILLSIGALFAGFAFDHYFVGEHRGEFWNGALKVVGGDVLEGIHHVPAYIYYMPWGCFIVGLALAWLMYIKSPDLPGRLRAQFEVVYQFLLNKWYFDELYHALFVVPAGMLGRLFWKQGDGRVIDGFGPDGVSSAVAEVARLSKRLQTGYVYHYAFVMLVGVSAAATWFVPKLFGK